MAGHELTIRWRGGCGGEEGGGSRHQCTAGVQRCVQGVEYSGQQFRCCLVAAFTVSVILAVVHPVIHHRLCAAVHRPEPAEPDGSASILHPAAVAVPDGAGGAAGAPPEPPPPGAQCVRAEKS